MNKLLGYIFKEKRFAILTIVFVIILGVLAPLRSFVFQKIIDSDSRGVLTTNLIIGVGFSLIVFTVEYASKFGLGKLLRETNFNLRRDVFNSIISQSIRNFNKKNSAEYISTLTNDLKILNDDYFSLMYDIFLQGILFIVAMVLIFLVSPILLLAVLLISVFQILLPKFFAVKLKKTRESYSTNVSGYVSNIKDVFSGYEVVKTFSIEDKISKKERKQNIILSESEYRSNITLYLAQTLSSVISNVSFIFVISVSMYLVLRGSMTVGYMVAITQMMNFVITPVKTMSQNISRIKSTVSIQEKLLEIMNIENHNVLETTIENLNDSIEFQDVSFSIDDKEILKGITFKIEKGKKYALVGGSGSGKSTLIKLLMRYYDDYDGSILIDKIDNRSISSESIFKMCPIIHQNVFMFNDTLKNNIALYNDYSDQEIRLAIELAGIEKLVGTLKNDIYETIDENGNNFSGGEKQRISIARALIKKPSMMILDEATSSLDNETAYQIEDAILGIPNLTSIVITHKYSEALLLKYDEIIVLKDGGIFEKGNFSELMKKKGYFYSLFSFESSV